MTDRSLKAFNRRRVLNFGTLSAVSLVALGLTRLPRHTAVGHSETASEPVDVKPTVLAFVGALFGRRLSAADFDDLSERLTYVFARNSSFKRECNFLARYLDRSARERGSTAFQSCSEPQKESIVDDIMRINPRSLIGRVLARSTQSEHDYYRMRSATVDRLARIYRYSSAAWRARGYRRWPGVGGDWHEILQPGAAYP